MLQFFTRLATEYQALNPVEQTQLLILAASAAVLLIGTALAAWELTK